MILSAALLLLAQAEPAPAPTAAEPPAEVKPKLICRRGQPTNSLVATRKVCLTQEEWERRDGAVARGTARATTEDRNERRN